MEAKRLRPSLPSAALAAAISKVLDDGDLLQEILLRLDFPTCLVRAALVCKRWLRHASDPVLLRRFDERHPPRLLGFYVESACLSLPKFVPLTLPPELAAAVRRARFDLQSADFYIGTSIYCCRNGRILVCDSSFSEYIYQVRSPLNPARDGVFFSTSHREFAHDKHHSRYMLLPEDGDDGLLVTLVSSQLEVFAAAQVLKAGAWDDVQTSGSIVLPANWNRSLNRDLLYNGKLYLLSTTGYVLVLELASMNLFYIELPDVVMLKDREARSLQLSLKLSHQAENSGLYIIHMKEFKIHVWLHIADGNSSGNWVLVDTISLHQVFGHLVKPSWESGDSLISLVGSGDNAEFVFLEVDGETFCIYIGSKTVEKVYEMEFKHDFLFQIIPFMMVWPPIIFPALIERNDQED